ncbi:hypothetical protein M3795_24960 [Ralstonia pickettii]|uniref:hypothetical protein n=1 Tax=Ralstonia pickettii TaxID=329 RepID=UPI00203B07DE|nr:hypothetical protein [Ralstonia pickettii]MCM3583723.1 hypothetical protein [Ralstonia pickettii]
MRISNTQMGWVIGLAITLGAWLAVQIIAVCLNFPLWATFLASVVVTFAALRLLYDPLFDSYMLWSMRRIVRKYDQDRAAADEAAEREPR